MKKTLLTSIAALFLATGTAHAADKKPDYNCDGVLVTVERLTSDHLANVEFTGFFKDLLIKKGFKFQFTNDGAKLNGKPCQKLEQ